MSITFTPVSPLTALTVTPVPGSLKFGEGHDVKGGGVIPHAMAGIAKNGSCQVVLNSVTPTLVEVLALRSAAGAGSVVVNGSDIPAANESYDALIDVTVDGEAVQVATIAWKGTTEEA